MSDKSQQLIDVLRESNDWTSAQLLAERLNVTSRSIRNYISTAKAMAEPFDIIEASPRGYKLNVQAYATFREAKTANPNASPANPRATANAAGWPTHPAFQIGQKFGRSSPASGSRAGSARAV